jgi:hypothetical protein
MEELREMLRTIIREELGKPKKAKAEFLELGRFNTGPNTQIRVSVSMGTDGRPILGLAKMHGTYIEQQFGFRLTEELAGALVNLINQHYPQLGQPTKKKGRGA